MPTKNPTKDVVMDQVVELTIAELLFDAQHDEAHIWNATELTKDYFAHPAHPMNEQYEAALAKAKVEAAAKAAKAAEAAAVRAAAAKAAADAKAMAKAIEQAARKAAGLGATSTTSRSTGGNASEKKAKFAEEVAMLQPKFDELVEFAGGVFQGNVHRALRLASLWFEDNGWTRNHYANCARATDGVAEGTLGAAWNYRHDDARDAEKLAAYNATFAGKTEAEGKV